MHDDEDKPQFMGPRARRCYGYCGGWRDADAFGTAGVFHFQVNVVEPLTAVDRRLHGYWCAGRIHPPEEVVIAMADGSEHPVEIVEFSPPPLSRAPQRPHLGSIVIRIKGAEPQTGTCIRAASSAGA